MKNKALFPILMLVLLLVVACTPKTTPAGANADSTGVVAADSTPVVLDSTAVADVPPVDADSAAGTAADGNQAGNATDQTAGSKVAAPAQAAKNRFTVSFISIGAGIDYKAKAKFDAFVIDFGKRNGGKLKFETVGWGREGETDYCFALTELNARQQGAFVQESKALLKDNELVQMTENAACRVPRK